MQTAEEAAALHERLVAHVHSVNGDPSPRSGVLQEHSYACGEGGARGRWGDVRVLLGPGEPLSSPRSGELDVGGAGDEAEGGGEAPPHEEVPDGWEDRVAAAAPHGKVARAVLHVLKDLRLWGLAAPLHAQDDTRHAARRVRRILASLWPTPHAPRLHAAMMANLPRLYRQLYQDVLAELRRTIPRLVERLAPGGQLPPAGEEPPRAGPAVMPCRSRPLLVWIGSGRVALDARWERRMRALVPTHYVRAWSRASGGPGAWCATVASAARSELAALEAGGVSWSLLAVGGAGAGAAVAALLAEDGRAGALVALGDTALTAEGPATVGRGSCPRLSVVGRGARARVRVLAARRGHPRDRVVSVPGADGALRLRARSRRTLLVSQVALDAAICDEAARWLYELADDPYDEDLEPDSPPHFDETSKRSIEIIEGRVVSRGVGGFPVSLPPPARPPPLPPGAPEVLGPRYTKVVLAKRG